MATRRKRTPKAELQPTGSDAVQALAGEVPRYVYFRATGVLDGVVGRVSGRRYTCTPKTLILAPEGEFEGIPNVKPLQQK